MYSTWPVLLKLNVIFLFKIRQNSKIYRIISVIILVIYQALQKHNYCPLVSAKMYSASITELTLTTFSSDFSNLCKYSDPLLRCQIKLKLIDAIMMSSGDNNSVQQEVLMSFCWSDAHTSWGHCSPSHLKLILKPITSKGRLFWRHTVRQRVLWVRVKIVTGSSYHSFIIVPLTAAHM